MACKVTLVVSDGREFPLGTFLEGKKSDTEIALTAARRYKNLVGKFQCHGHSLRVERKGGAVVVPVSREWVL